MVWGGEREGKNPNNCIFQVKTTSAESNWEKKKKKKGHLFSFPEGGIGHGAAFPDRGTMG